MKLEEAAAQAGLQTQEAQALVDQGLVIPDPDTGDFDAWRVAQFSVAKRAKELGIADQELAGLLSFLSKEATACAEMTALAEGRQAEIDAQLAALKDARAEQARLKGAA